MGGDDEEKQLRVKQEILATERSYCADMETVVEVFMKPMIQLSNDPNQAVASRDEIRLLFNNLESILFFNQQLLVALEEEFSAGQSSIGQIFIEMSPYLRMYCTYVNGHSRAAELHGELVSRLSKKDGIAKYQAFLESCALNHNDRLKNRQLTDLLIMPIQRVPRYRLLLEELIRRTPPGDEYDTLEMALAKIADVANLVNERLRESENRMMVITIQERLGNAVALVQPHRMFVMEGLLQKMCRKGPRDYVFILFSDVLVYGIGSNTNADEYDSEQTVTFKREIDLSSASIASVSDTSFKVSSPTKSFIVLAPEPSVKDTWFSAIQVCITNCATRAAEIAAESKEAAVSTNSTSSHTTTPSVGIAVDERAHAPVWVPDKDAPNCQMPECGVKFTLLNRKHHCRSCGLVCCQECSPHRWLLPNIDKTKSQRICNQCYMDIRGKLEEDNFESAGQLNMPRPAPPPSSSMSSFASGSTNIKGLSVPSSLLQLSAPSALFAKILKVSAVSSPRMTSYSRRSGVGPDTPSTSSPAASNNNKESGDRNKSFAPTSSHSDLTSGAGGDDLPRNWRVLKDEHGKIYYWNVITDLVQYERPTGRVKTLPTTSSSSTATNTKESDSKPSQAKLVGDTMASKSSASSKALSPKGSKDVPSSISKSSSPPQSSVFAFSTPAIKSRMSNDRLGSSGGRAADSNGGDRQLLPPGSPMISPRAIPTKPQSPPKTVASLPVNSSSKAATNARRKSMLMGPSLAERLQALSEQGVFGDPQYARFNVRSVASQWSQRVGSSEGSSTSLPPARARASNGASLLGARSASSSGLGSSAQQRSPMTGGGSGTAIRSSAAGSLPPQRSAGSNGGLPSFVRSAGSNGATAPARSNSTSPPSTVKSLSNAISSQSQSKLVSGRESSSLRSSTSPKNQSSTTKDGFSERAISNRYTPAFSSSGNALPVPINQSQGKRDISKLSEGEFLRVMGVSKVEFEKFPAYRKVELKQAKGVV